MDVVPSDSDFDFDESYADDDYSTDTSDYSSLHSSLLNEREYGGGAKSLQSKAHISQEKLNVSHRAGNNVDKMERIETTGNTKYQGRDDRATSEQVLDPRTRLILFKLLSTGFLSKIDGCLSTGKEANVYYALGGTTTTTAQTTTKDPNPATATEYAIKVYKTSILVFKDRDKYVSGEHRWRNGYCKSNPRKMVKVWAEKELRNYKRLWERGVKCPRPVMLKNHVLVMEFLGTSGWPSPRLRDASLNSKRMREAYVQCCLILRHMFQRANLVHGDFSEYNALWHNDQVYVIDVSQSVESDHPSALDFLRKDICNVNEYFRKAGRLEVMSTRQLFEFVTSTIIENTEESESLALDRLMEEVEDEREKLEGKSDQDRLKATHEADVAEAVFMSQFIPRSLSQVNEVELQRMEKGEREEDYVRAVAMLTGNQEVVDKLGGEGGVSIRVGGKNKQVVFEENNADKTEEPATNEGDDTNDDDDSDEEGGEEGDSSDYDSDDSGPRFVKIPMTPEQLQARKEAKRQERAANKKLVKEQQKEKRTTKIKKKDKKKAINKSKSKKAR